MAANEGQRIDGWRSVFSLPKIYQVAQWAIGAPNVRRTLADDYVQARPGDRVLDIGCGTGDMATMFDDVRYCGFDLSASYIEAAEQRYGHLGDFFVASVTDPERERDVFDKAFAKGVLHHLGDEDAVELFSGAKASLREGGVLVTVDPCFVEDQSAIARYLISQDRGLAVRRVDGYERLARSVFDNVEVAVHSDLLRVPYSHAFLICS